MKGIIKVTSAAIAAVGLSNAELWVKIFSAAAPAILSCGYIVWKWRNDYRKK